MSQIALLNALDDMAKLMGMGVFDGFDVAKMTGFVDDYISIHYPNKSKAAKQEMRDAMLQLGKKITDPKQDTSPTLKDMTKKARATAKDRVVGVGPRIGRTLTHTTGDLTNLVGNVVGMQAAAPYNVVAGAGNSISRTRGDDVLGTTNLAPIMQTAGMAYGAIPQAAVSGAGQVVGNTIRGIGDDFYDNAQEKQFQMNQYLTAQEILNSNITPSQAMLGGRMISGQNWSSKQNRKSPAVAGAGGN